MPKLKFKPPVKPAAEQQTPQSAAPMLKLKAKGKVPKRPLGVGYDSELDEREVDPVILEALIFRMLPGSDCDYIQDAVNKGLIGVHRAQGGADVRLRVFDTHGRRGVLHVRQNQYAFITVDLPCVIEGMKSWDKKVFMKSVDVSQMIIVLGPCKSDEEARNYPLPPDVDPKNYQYAHGITAPMKHVRTRRFAKTKRAKVDDIESIERRVNALLEADNAAASVSYQLLDYDPRENQDQYSSAYDEDEDAEGEDEDGGYFGMQNGGSAETPAGMNEELGEEDIEDITRMFAEDDEPETNVVPTNATSMLHPPEAADSSFAVTSTSATPSATAPQTPASAVEASSDEDEDDDVAEDEEPNDVDKEGDENLQRVKDQIADLNKKIAETMDKINETPNVIIRKKLARKVQDLEDDIAMMKKSAGLVEDEDEE